MDAAEKIRRYCEYQDRCEAEVRRKMAQLLVPAKERDTLMEQLKEERYVDDERFARAFAKDKVRYNKWGRRKVEQALWQKHIDEDIRKNVLNEIDDEEYLSVLRPLLKQKRKSTKAQNDYELNQKLMRFALGRGFTFDIIKQCIDVEDEGELVD